MASLITHPVIPLSIGLALGKKNIPVRVLLRGIVFSMLPDADVIAFRFGIPYEHMLGHRGVTHSIAFAAIISAGAAWVLHECRVTYLRTFLFLFIACVSHGVLDAMTSGGLGVGFFIPLNDERYFLPFRPIRVSPIGVKAFFSTWGMRVLLSELLWVWLPCISLALIVRKILTDSEKEF